MTLFQPPRPFVPICPDCRWRDVVPIVYGLPSAQLLHAARCGQVALGGCVISDAAPEWTCKVCGRNFNGDANAPTWR